MQAFTAMPVLNPTLKGDAPQSSRAAASIALSGVLLASCAFAAQKGLQLAPAYPYLVIGGFAVAGVAIARLAGRHLPGRSFGAANQVTLLRVALTALLLGLIGEAPSPALGWFALGLAVPALLLDGVDGWLARRCGTVSGFGARFDLEADALLIAVLALLAWRLDKAGDWVLLAGALRYAFVAAGRVAPWLRRGLPYSRRRQTVCVIQVAALLWCLAPWSTPPLSDWAAFAGVVTLSWSFAVDVRWLAKRARMPL